MSRPGYDGAGGEGDAMAEHAPARTYYVDPAPKPDPQLQAMLADPDAYFARARVEAEAEAREYVRREVARRETERAARRPSGWRRLFRPA